MTDLTRAEERALAADERAQELGPNDPRPPFTQAPGYVRGTNPDTELEVTFTPGESLPAWAVRLLPHATVDALGVLTLPAVMPPASVDAAKPRGGHAPRETRQ